MIEIEIIMHMQKIWKEYQMKEIEIIIHIYKVCKDYQMKEKIIKIKEILKED